MKNCNRIFFVGAVSLFVIMCNTQALAAARSNAGLDYLLRNPTLGNFTAGLYAGSVDREILVGGGPFSTTISSSRFYSYLGYDLSRWLNVYGIFGANEAELSTTDAADSELLYGAGLSFNLLNRFVREPIPMEDAIRINGDIRIISTKATFFMDTINWQEISASLRFSLVNFPVGDKHYRPEAIALYAGPAFSYIQSSAVEAKDEFGAIGGLEIFFYDSLSLDLSVEYFDTTSFFAGLNLRF